MPLTLRCSPRHSMVSRIAAWIHSQKLHDWALQSCGMENYFIASDVSKTKRRHP